MGRFAFDLVAELFGRLEEAAQDPLLPALKRRKWFGDDPSPNRLIVCNFTLVASYPRRDHWMQAVQFCGNSNLGYFGARSAKLFGVFRFECRRDRCSGERRGDGGLKRNAGTRIRQWRLFGPLTCSEP